VKWPITTENVLSHRVSGGDDETAWLSFDNSNTVFFCLLCSSSSRSKVAGKVSEYRGFRAKGEQRAARGER